MKITIGIVNYNRSKVLSPFPERSGSNYLFLLSKCIISLKKSVDAIEGITATQKSIDLLIVDFNSTDYPVNQWIVMYWPYDYRIIKLNEPFSIGRGRNILINQFSRDILILLDADMIVPVNFIQTVIEQAAKGFAIMPLYQRYINPEHTKTSDGIGYGNLIIRSDVVSFLRQKFTGKPYPESQTWGGEDVFVANAIKKSGKWPIKREFIAGFMHQWHPKTGDFYKQTGTVDKV
jgi:glycosyltransferase involved in cell wall biosynthesis